MGIKTFDPERAFSWSAMSKFKWSKEQWYQKYVMKIEAEKTPELIFGSWVDEKIQKSKKFLPHVIRYPLLQHRMETTFNGIPLVGLPDAYRPPVEVVIGKNKKKTNFKFDVLRPAIRDYKTGRNPWTQVRADETGQLTFYALLLWLTEGIRADDVEFYIDWLPTRYQDGKIVFIEKDHRKLKPKTFKTRRTMRQVLKFGQTIMDTYEEMLTYAKNHSDDLPHVRVAHPVNRHLK